MRVVSTKVDEKLFVRINDAMGKNVRRSAFIRSAIEFYIKTLNNDGVSINRDDVIAQAKHLGLAVFEKEAML